MPEFYTIFFPELGELRGSPLGPWPPSPTPMEFVLWAIIHRQRNAIRKHP